MIWMDIINLQAKAKIQIKNRIKIMFNSFQRFNYKTKILGKKLKRHNKVIK